MASEEQRQAARESAAKAHNLLYESARRNEEALGELGAAMRVFALNPSPYSPHPNP